MKIPAPPFRRSLFPRAARSGWFGCALLLAWPAAHVAAQTALYAEHDGRLAWVRRVEGRNAYVDAGQGRLEPASRRRYLLHEAPEFAPCFVTVRHLRVASTALTGFDGGDALNRQLEFSAEFESSFSLKNVFVVLDLSSKEAGRFLVLREIGDMTPRKPRTIRIAEPLKQETGDGHFKLHVFADGLEVFQSQMPRGFVDRMLDKMIAQRIAAATDAGPRPFAGPAPEYPAALRREKAPGKAVIELTVDPRGRVVDPRVKSASEPAFGDSALAAAREWRFLPQVKSGKPAAVNIEMPFEFNLP